MATDFSNIKCIAFDLDDTVLNSEKTLSERTKSAFADAAERGIALLPVTGRTWSTIPDAVRSLEGISYIVTSNGAATYDAQTGERVRECLVGAHAARTILRNLGRFFLEGQVSYEGFIDGIAYAAEDYVQNPTIYGIPQGSAEYIRQTRHGERFIIDFLFEEAPRLESLDIILKTPGLYRQVENTIRNNTEDVYITSSIPYRMEISGRDAGKAPGMLGALDLLGIAPEEVLAFGDGDSDAPMLAAAGIGVALRNGSAACKESADHVTELPAGEDGAADFLKKNFFL